MIDVKVIGSSSKGNAYLINDGERSLLLEAGINLTKRNVDLSNCDACLITHEHGDHSKYAMDIINTSGMDVYMSAGTQKALQLPRHRVKEIKALEEFQVGNWRVLPFDTEHNMPKASKFNVNEPLGFFIQAKSGENILFATDTKYIRYKLPGITHLMIECNYQLEIINDNVMNGTIHASLRDRIVATHFELQNVKKFIQSNDMSTLQEVWLLHLSSSNADPTFFKEEIQAITGVPVYVAE